MEVQQTQLGNLSVGSIADIAVLNIRHGDFGFTDGGGALMKGHEKTECELTIKDGKFIYDLNGRSSALWNQPPGEAAKFASKWTSLRTPGGARAAQQAQAQAAAAARRPQRWSPYATDEKGVTTLKANAKLAPIGTTKTPGPKVAQPASEWATSPSANWPAKQQ